jgi:hypothetical protein
MAPPSDAGFQATLAALLAIELSASAAVAEAGRVRIGEGEIAFGGSGSGQWSKAGSDGSTSPARSRPAPALRSLIGQACGASSPCTSADAVDAHARRVPAIGEAAHCQTSTVSARSVVQLCRATQRRPRLARRFKQDCMQPSYRDVPA